jgi:hypothetical protein
MNWALETRLLSRFLIDYHPNIDEVKKSEILENSKEKAQHYIKGLIGDVAD